MQTQCSNMSLNNSIASFTSTDCQPPLQPDLKMCPTNKVLVSLGLFTRGRTEKNWNKVSLYLEDSCVTEMTLLDGK